MKTQLSHTEREAIANEIFDYQNSFKNTATMFRPHRKLFPNLGITEDVERLRVSELMKLTDTELLELKDKVQAAQKAKEVKTRQSRYFLK